MLIIIKEKEVLDYLAVTNQGTEFTTEHLQERVVKELKRYQQVYLQSIIPLESAVAIGNSAGRLSQGKDSVAIGTEAGQTSQNKESIAIGLYSGQMSLCDQ